MATVKSFVRKNSDQLMINVKSSFDGMIDGCQWLNEGFKKAAPDTDHASHTLGIKGAWFVGQSRDYFTPFEENNLTGITVSNSCGHFVLAIPNA